VNFDFARAGVGWGFEKLVDFVESWVVGSESFGWVGCEVGGSCCGFGFESWIDFDGFVGFESSIGFGFGNWVGSENLSFVRSLSCN
jgi:hypothetical protein